MDKDMKSANKNSNLQPIRQLDGIVITKAKTSTIGSCNVCDADRNGVHYTIDSIMTEVQLRGMTFRLCSLHRKRLKSLL